MTLIFILQVSFSQLDMRLVFEASKAMITGVTDVEVTNTSGVNIKDFQVLFFIRIHIPFSTNPLIWMRLSSFLVLTQTTEIFPRTINFSDISEGAKTPLIPPKGLKSPIQDM